MALINNVSKKCDQLNKINRKVTEHSSSLHVDKLFARVDSDNFLIHGGYHYERNQILESAVMEICHKNNNPIIILNNDSTLENALINLAVERKIHKITVSSNKYRNYDLFANMSIDLISEIFKEKDLLHNGNGSDVYAYAKAFLKVLQTKYSVCLRSILALSNRSDDDIYEFGRIMGANDGDLRIIQQSGFPSIRFRNYLRNFELAFNHINSDEDTNYNLANAKDKNQIYLIDCNSYDCNSFNLVVSYELKQLLKRRIPFTLIVNNIYLENKEPLVQTIQRAKVDYQIQVGISVENVVSWARNSGAFDKLIGDFPIQLLLNTKSVDSTDVETLISRFGKYHHYEYTVGVHTKLFRLPWQKEIQHGTIQYEKNRITMSEFNKCKVLVKGCNDEIDLYIDFR